MACSSKLVEPMMMVGFEAAEATAEGLRVTNMVSATATMRRGVKRMSGPFRGGNWSGASGTRIAIVTNPVSSHDCNDDLIMSRSLRIVKVAGQRGRSGRRGPLDGRSRGQHVPRSTMMAQPGWCDRSLEQAKRDGEEGGQQDDQERGAECLDAVIAAQAGQQGRPQVRVAHVGGQGRRGHHLDGPRADAGHDEGYRQEQSPPVRCLPTPY